MAEEDDDDGYSYKTPELVGGGIPIVDPEYIDAVTGHVEATVGKTGNLFHEVMSQHVHLDVLVVPAWQGRPWTTLVTCGMGCRRMAVPPDMAAYSRAELVLCLPRDWPPLSAGAGPNLNFDEGGGAEDGHPDPGEAGPGGWIVPLLQFYARMPFKYDTWFGDGHTIPNGDPAEPIAPESRLCCAMLGKSRRLGSAFHRFTLPNGENVHFWNVWFITEEEMRFKLRKGADALRERLKEHKVDELLRLDRPSACKGGFMGFFQ